MARARDRAIENPIQGETPMPILKNPRREKFAQEVASGKSLTKNAQRLRAEPEVSGRTEELQWQGAERAVVTVVRETGKLGALGGYRPKKIYGRLDCPSALRWIAQGKYAKHQVFFADEMTAISAGFRPCQRCLRQRYSLWKMDRDDWLWTAASGSDLLS
jgi:hypothetical protein